MFLSAGILHCTTEYPLPPAHRSSDTLVLTLPAHIYTIPQTETALYFENIAPFDALSSYRLDIQCEQGIGTVNGWVWQPLHSGDYKIALTVNDSSERVLHRESSSLHVASYNAGVGESITILLVGNSLTEARIYPVKLAQLLDRPGNPSWTMIGSKRAVHDVAFEADGGKTWKFYATHRYSPFTAEKDGETVLDIEGYFDDSCGGACPDFVVFSLGLNDCFETDLSCTPCVDSCIDSSLFYTEHLIGRFRKSVPGAHYGICTMVPPNSRHESFKYSYNYSIVFTTWKRMQHKYVAAQLEQFDGREEENIFCIPTHLCIDPDKGYPAENALHPNESGYEQIAEQIYAWLKYQIGHYLQH
jgi:lysophospholipase L1-like esterase